MYNATTRQKNIKTIQLKGYKTAKNQDSPHVNWHISQSDISLNNLNDNIHFLNSLINLFYWHSWVLFLSISTISVSTHCSQSQSCLNHMYTVPKKTAFEYYFDKEVSIH